MVAASPIAPVFSSAEPESRQFPGQNEATQYSCTLEICALDQTHPRPAAQGACFARQLGRDCPKVLWKPRNCQSRLIQHVMGPAEADVGLEGVLTLRAIFFDCCEQRGYDL